MEGKNRQVKKMFEKVGHDVEKLKRVAIGQLKLGSLKQGDYRPLTRKDLEKLFSLKQKTAKRKKKITEEK